MGIFEGLPQPASEMLFQYNDDKDIRLSTEEDMLTSARPVPVGKLVILMMKHFHFGVLAFLQGQYKCFQLNLPSNFFFTLTILQTNCVEKTIIKVTYLSK